MIDVYKIGVELSLMGNLAGGMQALLREFGIFNTQIGHINKNLGKTRELLLGLGMVAAGVGMAKFLIDTTKEADKLYEKLLAIKQMGGEYATPAGQAQMQAAVFDIHRAVPTSSALDAATLMQHMASITHAGAAEPSAKGLLMAQAVLKQAGISESEEDLTTLLRVIDLRGHMYNDKGQFDAESFAKELQAATAAIMFTGGMLTPNDMLQMVRQGGAAARQQSTSSFFGAGAEVAIGMGAGRTGTAETSLFAQLVGGIMPLRVANEMERMGLLQPGDYKNARGGRVIMSKQGSERNVSALNDPEAWIQDKLIPQLKKHGVTKPEDIITEIFRLFGRQTTQRFVADVINNAPQVQRGRDMLNMSPDLITKYKEIMDNSLTANIDAFTKSWETFQQSFGGPGIRAAIDMLQLGTKALNSLTDVMVTHPTIAKDLFELAAALSAFLLLGGSLKIMAVALGPFATGIRAIAGIAGLATVGASLSGIAAGLSALLGPIAAIMAVLKVGSDHETPESQAARENLRKGMTVTPPSHLKPNDGFDESGRPIKKESFIAPGGSRPHIQTIVYTQLDGKTIARTVSEEQARYMDLPSSSASRFDGKMSPSYTHDAVRI